MIARSVTLKTCLIIILGYLNNSYTMAVGSVYELGPTILHC